VTGISKSQLDKLGSRLRNSAVPEESDLRLLDECRHEFIGLIERVLQTLRRTTEYPVECRHKTIPSIIARLRRRNPARLSEMQDIAGAHIIVAKTSGSH